MAKSFSSDTTYFYVRCLGLRVSLAFSHLAVTRQTRAQRLVTCLNTCPPITNTTGEPGTFTTARQTLTSDNF